VGHCRPACSRCAHRAGGHSNFLATPLKNKVCVAHNNALRKRHWLHANKDNKRNVTPTMTTTESRRLLSSALISLVAFVVLGISCQTQILQLLQHEYEHRLSNVEKPTSQARTSTRGGRLSGRSKQSSHSGEEEDDSNDLRFVICTRVRYVGEK
jgi:hypothetical protein